MTERAAEPESPPAPSPESAHRPSALSRLFTLRRPISRWLFALMGVVFLLLILGIWGMVTAGEAEERVVSRLVLPSPAETVESLAKKIDQGQGLLGTMINDEQLAKDFKALIKKLKEKPITAKVRLF